MTDLMVHFNWSYIHVLNGEGPYYENGGKQVLVVFSVINQRKGPISGVILGAERPTFLQVTPYIKGLGNVFADSA